MTKFNRILLTTLVGVSLGAGMGDAAHAARMGGGKSFGSRPSYSQPYRAPSNSQASPAQAQSAYQNPAAARNQATRESLTRRGGLMGMLGGLALGGLLGAMLFGGAFEHINLLDILIFAGIAFILFKLLASRRTASPGVSSADRQAYRAEAVDNNFGSYQRTRAAANVTGGPRPDFDTDALFRAGNRSAGSGSAGVSPAATVLTPADFDADGFLYGAKAAYTHLQAAWDRADLAELRSLTTDKVFAELQEQLRGRSGENTTELLSVNASLLDVRDVGLDREASVLFKVVMKESVEASPADVSEIWHFTRSRSSRQPTWYLDGIQQTDA